MTTQPARVPFRPAAAFGWILAAALAVRLCGVGFGLPHVYHQDEPILVNHALAYGVEGLATKLFLPPPLSTYLLFFLYALLFALSKLLGAVPDAAAFGVWFLRDPSAFYLIGRCALGVLPGVLAVAMLGRWIGREWGRTAGLWAMSFLALAPLHAQLSHYLYMDAPLCAALVGFYASLSRWSEHPGRRHALAAGFFWGLAAAFKYTALYFAPMVLLAWVIGSLRSRRLDLPGLAAVGLGALATFAVTTPFAFLSWTEFLSQVRAQAGARGSVGWAHHLFYSLVEGSGWALIACAAAGFAVMLRKRVAAALLLGACALTYYAVNVYFSQEYARYALPLLPLVCAFAGYAVQWSIGLKMRHAGMIAGLLTVVELAAPTLYTDALFLSKDTRTRALEWIEDNVPQGEVFALDNRFFGPPLAPTAEQVRSKGAYLSAADAGSARSKRLELAVEALKGRRTYETYTLSAEGAEEESSFLFMKPIVRAGTEEIDRAGIRYLVLNHGDRDTRKHAFVRHLGARAELVASFSPYRDPSKRADMDPWASTAAPHLRAEIFSRQSLGPYLEIYRIRPAAGGD